MPARLKETKEMEKMDEATKKTLVTLEKLKMSFNFDGVFSGEQIQTHIDRVIKHVEDGGE